MRVFAALPLPQAAVEELDRIIHSLRQRLAGLKYVSSKAMHLTVHFFGELPEEAVAGLKRTFKDPELGRAPIAAGFGPIGRFPEKGPLRILHVGIDKGREELAAYWKLFHSKIAPLASLGGDPENWLPDARGFSPHVTLARAGRDRVDEAALSGFLAPRAPSRSIGPQGSHRPDRPGWPNGHRLDFTFSELVLFQSILKPHGPQYVPLETIQFTGAAG